MAVDLGKQIVARWPDPDASHVPLLRQANIEAVLLDQPNESFERACTAAGIASAPASVAAGVPSMGLWPGIRSQPNARGNNDVASASREPWVDANGYLYACRRVLYPERPAVLGFLPNARAGVPSSRMIEFNTLPIALAEARVNGGNFLLAVESRYREALLKGDAKATEAWKSLGVTARWLRENAARFGRPPIPAITMLIEEGRNTVELANLGFRRNACPALALASNPPAPSPALLCLSAASIQTPAPAVRSRVLAHAESGATVAVDAPGPDAWWRDTRLRAVKDEGDREVFALGKGRVIAYRKPIADPSEYALDLIDFVGHQRRAARHWNATTVVLHPMTGRKPGEELLHLVNYGSRFDREIQIRVHGAFSTAAFERPGAPPVALKTARRGAMTEVQVPSLDAVATVIFG